MLNRTCEISECQFCPNRFTSVLCKVKEEYAKEFNSAKVSSFYKKGQVIFNEGAHPFGVYCIYYGKVKLYRSGDDGKEHITRLLRSGDVVGYRALLNGERLIASAVALEDTLTCFIPKDVFVRVLKNDPTLAVELLSSLSKDLHQAEIRITHMVQKPVRERLATTLLFLKDVYGLEKDDSTINVRLSREEIANLAGAATESIIRLMTDFKKEGILELEGKKIKISNLRGLILAANIQE